MKEAARGGTERTAPAGFGKRRRYIVRSHRSKGVPIPEVERAEFGFAKPGRISQHGIEHRLQFAGIAVCCSRASASSRVRVLTRSCRSATVELAGRAAVRALLRAGLAVLPCRVFAGLRLMVPRRLTSCSRWADDRSLAQQQVCCAAQ